MAERITSRAENYSQWYIDIVLRAQLADYSPVRGCMVIRPQGYALWERMQRALDDMFKETGHSNAYFPLLIPESFIKKEADHVEGFSPELAVVTHAGGEELEEPLVLRPTSETIIWSMYQKWIQSYRDLPILINQWANVLRWEKRTRLFLRNREFLWQEGHTAHATKQEAEEETLRMLLVYKRFAEEFMALPVLSGRKSESEKFAGAIDTYAIEGMMQDCRALQAGTSHFLGQNFAKAFDVTFQSKEGVLEHVWATSWGVSTRLVGALIMTHSDDKGLVLPPKLASTEVVIIPIFKSDNKSNVLDYAERVKKGLSSSYRTVMDDDEQNSPGWKFSEWEMKGIPVRIEIGPRDMEANKVVIVRRDTGEKRSVPVNETAAVVGKTLEAIQHSLYRKAVDFRENNTYHINSYDDFKKLFSDTDGGFVYAPWCGDPQCETSIQEETAATIRVLMDQTYADLQPKDDTRQTEAGCIVCGKKTQYVPVFAKAY